jgi:enoyl-CoA hydratase/carnithine racemase
MRANPERQHYETLFAQCSRLMTAIVRLPKPVIASVHGIATAAGCQLVASCDLAVASSAARFGVNGIDVGLFCSTPMVALTRAVGRKPAMEMLLTGDLVDAVHARSIGLVNRVTAPAQLEDETRALARQIASRLPLAVALGKEAFYRQAELGLDAAYTYTSEVMTRNMLAPETEEGIDAFLEKRPPRWDRD